MGFRVYAKAGTVRVRTFLHGDIYTVVAKFQMVATPRAFISRVRTNPRGKLVGGATCVSHEGEEVTQIEAADLVKFQLPNGTEEVRLLFMTHYSFGSNFFFVTANILAGSVELLGSREAVVDLLEWLHMSFSDFKLVRAKKEKVNWEDL